MRQGKSPPLIIWFGARRVEMWVIFMQTEYRFGSHSGSECAWCVSSERRQFRGFFYHVFTPACVHKAESMSIYSLSCGRNAFLRSLSTYVTCVVIARRNCLFAGLPMTN